MEDGSLELTSSRGARRDTTMLLQLLSCPLSSRLRLCPPAIPIGCCSTPSSLPAHSNPEQPLCPRCWPRCLSPRRDVQLRAQPSRAEGSPGAGGEPLRAPPRCRQHCPGDQRPSQEPSPAPSCPSLPGDSLGAIQPPPAPPGGTVGADPAVSIQPSCSPWALSSPSSVAKVGTSSPPCAPRHSSAQ